MFKKKVKDKKCKMQDEQVVRIIPEQEDELEWYKIYLKYILTEMEVESWDDLTPAQRQEVIPEMNNLADDMIGFDDRHYILMCLVDENNQLRMAAVAKKHINNKSVVY